MDTGRADTQPPRIPRGAWLAAGAAVAVLRSYYGTDKVAFDFDSTTGTTRIDNLEALPDDITIARISGGMHFRRSTVDGERSARSGNWVVSSRLHRSRRRGGAQWRLHISLNRWAWVSLTSSFSSRDFSRTNTRPPKSRVTPSMALALTMVDRWIVQKHAGVELGLQFLERPPDQGLALEAVTTRVYLVSEAKYSTSSTMMTLSSLPCEALIQRR